MLSDNAKEKADAYVGHPYEIDEGSHITNVRQAYIAGYNACVEDVGKLFIKKITYKSFDKLLYFAIFAL